MVRPVVANAIDTVGRHRGGANEGDTPKGLDGRAGSGAGMLGEEWRRDVGAGWGQTCEIRME